MVKPPKIRHSRPRPDQNPVTIDLTPNAPVSENEDGTTSTPPAGQPASTFAPKQAAEPIANDAGAAKPFAASASDVKPAASAETPSRPDTPFRDNTPDADRARAQASSAASSSSSTPFGRQPGEAAKPADPKPAAPKTSVPPSAPRTEKARGGPSLVVAAILGGVIALGIGYGLMAAGVLPGGSTGGNAEIETLRQEVATLKSAPAPAPATDPAIAQRLDALAMSVDALKAAPAPAADTSALDAVNQKVAALEGSVSALSGTDTKTALDAIDAKLTALEQRAGDQTAAVAAATQAQAGFTSRLATIEERLATLGESIEGQPRMALAIAATALKAAIDRGDPFSTELDTYQAVAPEGVDIAPLKALAAKGVPTREAISATAGATAEAVIAAEVPAGADAGVFDRLMSSAQGLVSVRPVGAVEGEGVPAIAARMEAATLAGDYDVALVEYAKLPEIPRSAATEQALKITARRDADRLIETAMAGALKPAAPAAANGG